MSPKTVAYFFYFKSFLRFFKIYCIVTEFLSFLPNSIRKLISRLDYNKLYEIRLRIYMPIYVLYENKYQFIAKNEFLVTQTDLNDLILALTKHSIYAYEDNIRQGFLTGDCGERVGLCGNCVYQNGQVLTIKDISSVCIRVPHQILGIANQLFDSIYKDEVESTLIISPPGLGKTTLLREIVRKTSILKGKNILVIDEKGEIFAKSGYNLGYTVDVLTNADKLYGFNKAIANLKPDLIVCDELACESDVNGVIFGALSGVTVISTAHAQSLEELKMKESFYKLFDYKIFKYAVILSNSKGIGTIEGVIKL